MYRLLGRTEVEDAFFSALRPLLSWAFSQISTSLEQVEPELCRWYAGLRFFRARSANNRIWIEVKLSPVGNGSFVVTGLLVTTTGVLSRKDFSEAELGASGVELQICPAVELDLAST